MSDALSYLLEARTLGEQATDGEENIKEEYQSTFSSKLYEILTAYLRENNVKSDDAKDRKIVEIMRLFADLIDEEAYQKVSRERIIDNEKWKRSAIHRLIMMFIKYTREINYLLSGGYANAAFARIRSVYEVCVHYEIIIKSDNGIAKRYLEHANTNRLKIAKALYDMKSYMSISKEIEEFDYEKSFLKENQWANPLIRKKRITFKDLIDYSQYHDVKDVYIMACSSVHASVFSSVNGLDIPRSIEREKLWNTTPIDHGVDMVVSAYCRVVNRIMFDIFSDTSPESMLCIMCFSELVYTAIDRDFEREVIMKDSSTV